jgi:hypothetical protein
MKKLFVILFFSVTCYSGKAQFLDSVQTSLDRGGSFSLIFNSRHSSITNYDAYVFALMIGVRFDKKIGLGGGINQLAPAIQDTFHQEGQTVYRYLYLTYISYYIEYLIKLTKHWEIDLFFMPGIGSAYREYTFQGQTITQNKGLVIPLEPSACVEYDFTKWLGVYVQAGYRWMLVNDNAIHENFNSPTYAAGLIIYPLEIYSGLFPHTKLAHMIDD